MNKNLLLALLSVCVLLSCTSDKEVKLPVDSKSVFAVLDSIMLAQQNAWNEADIEQFMQAYDQSDSILFTGGKGIVYGWQKVLDNYKTAYPGKSGMGELLFENSDMRFVPDSAAVVAGKWTLFRETDTLSGRYTLVWRNIDGVWKIIADHSS